MKLLPIYYLMSFLPHNGVSILPYLNCTTMMHRFSAFRTLLLQTLFVKNPEKPSN